MKNAAYLRNKMNDNALYLRKEKNFEDAIFPYALMFMACLNPFENGALIWLFYACYSFFFYRSGYRFDYNFFLCAVVSIALAIASMMFFSLTDVVKSFILVLSYLAGICNYNRAANKENYIKRVVFVFFVAYLTLIVLLYAYNELHGWSSRTREIYSIWTGEPTSVTLVGLLCSLIVGYSFFQYFCKRGYARIFWAFVGLGTVVVFNLRTATRTPFVLAALVFGCASLFFYTNAVGKEKSKYLFQFLILIVALGAAWGFNVGNMRDGVQKSALVERIVDDGEGLNTPRTKIFVEHLSLTLQDWQGGQAISRKTGHLAHNLLQDTHDHYGIVASTGIMLLMFSFITLYFKFWRYRTYHSETTFLLFFMYTAVIPQLMLEPIWDGYPLLLWNFVFIHALATAYCQERFTNGYN